MFALDLDRLLSLGSGLEYVNLEAMLGQAELSCFCDVVLSRFLGLVELRLDTLGYFIRDSRNGGDFLHGGFSYSVYRSKVVQHELTSFRSDATDAI